MVEKSSQDAVAGNGTPGQQAGAVKLGVSKELIRAREIQKLESKVTEAAHAAGLFVCTMIYDPDPTKLYVGIGEEEIHRKSVPRLLRRDKITETMLRYHVGTVSLADPKDNGAAQQELHVAAYCDREKEKGTWEKLERFAVMLADSAKMGVTVELQKDRRQYYSVHWSEK